ncbi:MAG: hypothetical protein ABI635_07960 [Actinomycetota bacterium]
MRDVKIMESSGSDTSIRTSSDRYLSPGLRAPRDQSPGGRTGAARQTYGRRQDGAPRRYLVVANLTVAGESLATKVRECMREGPCTFHVVVPASADPRVLTWTEGAVLAAARGRLDAALSELLTLGAEVEGEVGDWTPMAAIEDALRAERFDEIIISTLPPGLSRWLNLDLAHRAAERFHLPVSHVVSATSAASRSAASTARAVALGRR